MTIRQKLIAGFSLTLLLLLVQGLFSGWLFKESRDLGESVKRDEMPLLLQAMTLREQLYRVEGVLQGWIVMGDEPFRQQYQQLWGEISQIVQQIGEPELIQQADALQQIQDEVMILAHTLEAQPATRLMREKIEPAAMEIQESSKRLLFFERRRHIGSSNPLQLKQSKFRAYTLSNFQRAFSEANSILKNVLLGGVEGGLARFTQAWRESEGAWGTINRSDLTSKQQNEVEKIRALRAQFLLNAMELIEIRRSDRWDLAAWKMKHRVAPLQKTLLASVGALVSMRSQQMTQAFTQQTAVMDEGRQMVWIFLAVALVAMLLTARAVTQGIRRPIRKVQQVFQDIHDKNYHTPIKIESEDEMGGLLRSLQGMRQQLLDAELEEQAHRMALQNQKFAIDQAAIVSATDLEGNINYINQRMLDLSGYQEEDLLGKNHRLMKSDEHDGAFYALMWRTISAGLVWRGEVCNQTRDGRKIWLDTTIVPFLGEDLLPVQYMAIRHDITLIKESEQKIRDEQSRTVTANEELQRSMQELQETQEQLVESEKMAALGGLVAGVAHEVNTPLGIGVTAASFLKDQALEFVQRYRSQQMKRSDLERFLSQAEESTGIVLENLERASALVKSFKQIAVDQSSGEQRPFAVVPYLQDLVRSLQPKLKRLPHLIEIEGSDQIEMVGDPGALAQVVTNLVMNAVIHGLKDDVAGKISMAVSQSEEHIQINFQDNGKGASAEVVEKIFEPFFTTRRGSGGSGLGMHLVYNLVTQKMGGEIHCSSEEGKGMCFELIFPV